MKRALILVLPFLAGLVADRLLIERPVLGQTASNARITPPQLSIGYTTITVGMPKEQAIAALSAYQLGSTKEGESTIIATKPVIRNGAPDNSNIHILGTLRFENGLVSEISRYWGTGAGPEVERVWQALWGAVASTVPENRPTTVLLQTHTTRSPQHNYAEIRIVLDHRVVSIQRGQSEFQEPDAVRSFSDVSIEEFVF